MVTARPPFVGSPFVPERIVIFNRLLDLNDTPSGKRIRKNVLAMRGPSDIGKPFPPRDKVNILMHTIRRMTNYYGRPDLTDPWTANLIEREALGSSSLGHGVGLVHQFQRRTDTIATASPLVDWWLFVAPHAVPFDAHDDVPVHALIGHVAARYPGQLMKQWCEVGTLTSRVHDKLGWKAIAEMDRMSAAEVLNEELAQLRQEHGLCWGGMGYRDNVRLMDMRVVAWELRHETEARPSIREAEYG